MGRLDTSVTTLPEAPRRVTASDTTPSWRLAEAVERAGEARRRAAEDDTWNRAQERQRESWAAEARQRDDAARRDWTARLDATLRSGYVLGTESMTGFPIAIPESALDVGGYFTAPSGSGKTATAAALLGGQMLRECPLLVVDDVGEAYRRIERFAAYDLKRLRWRLQREEEILGFASPEEDADTIRQWIAERYTFAFAGRSRRANVGIDVLKRRARPDGSLESVEEVMTGNLKPFEARFADDIEKRTRFLTVTEPSLAVLIAAGRPISEIFDLVNTPAYWPFLMRQLRDARTLDDMDRDYVRPRLQDLRSLLDLRRSRDGSESSPFPERYRTLVESTLNAFRPYRAGGMLAKMVSEDTFDPTRVVQGAGVFCLTSDIPDDLVRAHVHGTFWSFFERLMRYRMPGACGPTLYILLDEFTRWFYPSLASFFAVARNHNVSVFALNQDDEQWRARGMAPMASIVPSLLHLRLRWRPSTKDAAETMALALEQYTPFGVSHRESMIADSASTSYGTTRDESESEGDTDGYGSSLSRMEGEQWGDGKTDSYGYNDDDRYHYGEASGWRDARSRQEGSSDSMSRSYTKGRSRRHGASAQQGSSRTTSDAVFYAGSSEQHLLRIQDMLHLGPRTALLTHEGNSRMIDMLLPYEPDVTDAEIDELHAVISTASVPRSDRPAFEPTITLRTTSATPPTPKTTPAHPGAKKVDRGRSKPA